MLSHRYIAIYINTFSSGMKFHGFCFVSILQINSNPCLIDSTNLFNFLLIEFIYSDACRCIILIRLPIINQNLTLCQRLLVFIECHRRSIACPQHTCHRACGETSQDGACNPLILSLHYPHLLWHFHVNPCVNLYRYTLRHYIKKSPLKIKTRQILIFKGDFTKAHFSTHKEHARAYTKQGTCTGVFE